MDFRPSRPMVILPEAPTGIAPVQIMDAEGRVIKVVAGEKFHQEYGDPFCKNCNENHLGRETPCRRMYFIHKVDGLGRSSFQEAEPAGELASVGEHQHAKTKSTGLSDAESPDPPKIHRQQAAVTAARPSFHLVHRGPHQCGERCETIKKMVRDGVPLRLIGGRVGLSYERIRQISNKHGWSKS